MAYTRGVGRGLIAHILFNHIVIVCQRYHKRCEEKHSNTTAHHPVVSVGVCYTAVDAAAGGLTTGWWAVVLECFSSHLLQM